MPTIEGVVSAVSVKERNTPYGQKKATSFQVDGNWYSGGFKVWEVDKGDRVRLTFETNQNGYHDVKGIAVLEKGAPAAPTAAQSGAPRSGRSFPVDPLAPERTINRQNALTAAVAFCNHNAGPGEFLPEDVVSVARAFESYTTGDLDRQEVEQMIAAESGGVQT